MNVLPININTQSRPNFNALNTSKFKKAGRIYQNSNIYAKDIKLNTSKLSNNCEKIKERIDKFIVNNGEAFVISSALLGFIPTFACGCVISNPLCTLGALLTAAIGVVAGIIIHYERFDKAMLKNSEPHKEYISCDVLIRHDGNENAYLKAELDEEELDEVELDKDKLKGNEVNTEVNFDECPCNDCCVFNNQNYRTVDYDDVQECYNRYHSSKASRHDFYYDEDGKFEKFKKYYEDYYGCDFDEDKLREVYDSIKDNSGPPFDAFY